MHQARLLEAHAALTAAIRSAEAWEQSYTRSPKTFKRLVAGEAVLQSNVNEYLLGLRERVLRIVNWSDVEIAPVKASAVPPTSDDLWKDEAKLLAAALADQILELAVVGANAGEEIYGVPLGINSLDDAVVKAAGDYTAQLVSDVTGTTRRYIQSSIKTSIKQGEDLQQMVERIQKRVANPVRAEMIAQTESVNAYQLGLEHFAIESGAASSTWDSLLGACQLCAPINGTTKAIGKAFVLGNGKQVMRPPAHVKCRCGRILNYE